MTWTCQDTPRCLAEDRLTELSPGDRAALSEHVKTCPACRSQVAEDGALDELLSRFLAPAGVSTKALSEEERSGLARQIRGDISKRPPRTLPRSILRTLKWAAVVLLLVVGSMAATESGRTQLGKLSAILRETFSTRWEAPSGSVYTRGADEPFDRAAAQQEFAEIDGLKREGKGRLTGLIEAPDLTTYCIEYTLASGKVVSIGSSRPQGAQAEAMHLDEIERLRREGKGRLVSQEDFPLGLGSFKIAYTLGSGEEIVLRTQYPPGPEGDRERIFDQIREQRRWGSGRILNLRVDESGTLSGVMQYTLSDGRKAGHSQVFGTLDSKEDIVLQRR